MSKSSRRIYNLQGLDYEIQQLQKKTRSLEKEIDQKLDHFQANYSSIFLKTLLPGLGINSSLLGTALQFIFRNKRFQNSVGKLTDQIFDKISDGVEFVTNKLDGTKNSIEQESPSRSNS
jgi:hypothetical protein